MHHPLVTDARSLLWMANQNTITPHVWTSRAPDLYHTRTLRLRSRSVATTTSPTCCARRRSRCATCSTSSGLPSWVKTSGLEGLPHRRPARRQGRDRRGRAVRARRRHGPRRARPDAPDAGVQQGRSRRPHPGRHRAQRLQRDVRRRLRGARRSPARRCRRRARGRRSRAARSARGRSRCGTWRRAPRRSATCGPECGGASGRSHARLSA